MVEFQGSGLPRNDERNLVTPAPHPLALAAPRPLAATTASVCQHRLGVVLPCPQGRPRRPWVSGRWRLGREGGGGRRHEGDADPLVGRLSPAQSGEDVGECREGRQPLLTNLCARACLAGRPAGKIDLFTAHPACGHRKPAGQQHRVALWSFARLWEQTTTRDHFRHACLFLAPAAAVLADDLHLLLSRPAAGSRAERSTPTTRCCLPPSAAAAAATMQAHRAELYRTSIRTSSRENSANR